MAAAILLAGGARSASGARYYGEEAEQQQQPQALGYENLLHELIMAMQGYTGDVFLDVSDARCDNMARC